MTNPPGNFDYQDGQLPPDRSRPGSVDPMRYKFSPEEARVLAECNRESFFRRSLPFSTVLGLGTFAAIRNGYLKPNPRFGAIPKVSLAVIAGYFLGKLSYQKACAEKLMALPGSYIGQLLRDKRDGTSGGSPPPRPVSPPMLGAGPGDIYSDAGPGNSLDLDLDRPLFSDDSYRPDIEETVTNTSSLAYHMELIINRCCNKTYGNVVNDKKEYKEEDEDDDEEEFDDDDQEEDDEEVEQDEEEEEEGSMLYQMDKSLF